MQVLSVDFYIYLHGRIVSLSLSLSSNYDTLILAFLLNVFFFLKEYCILF